MKNFHAHQIEHMAQVLQQRGISFVLLHFSTLKETYLLPARPLIDFYQIDQEASLCLLTIFASMVLKLKWGLPQSTLSGYR